MYVEMDPVPVLGALQDEVVFGQSASSQPAVSKLQSRLRVIADETGNMDYHPGPVDGQYGMNTHAAILRISRDYLEPEGLVSSTCRSTCNTLWARAKSACKDCLGTILGAMAQKVDGVDLSSADINDIANAYGEFLDAYIAKYGDGGQLDPAQIARREDVSLDEAERLAMERSGETGDTVAEADIQQTPPPTRAAKFPWLAVGLVVVLVGGAAAAGWYYSRKGETEEAPERAYW